MGYITPKEAANKWGISQRRVHLLCAQGRVRGAERHGGIWLIPDTADKPEDKRLKSTAGSSPARAAGLAAPSPPRNAMTRHRLLNKIAPPGKRLTYIHADAGYGKTTLLAQYAAGRPNVLWLTIEEQDSDVLTFLQRLERSARAVLGQFDFHATDFIPLAGGAAAGGDALTPAVLSALLGAIGDRELTVILDNVHLCTEENERPRVAHSMVSCAGNGEQRGGGEAVTRLLTEWVKACPATQTLIMASRHEPWSGLLRTRLEGRVSELTKDDLRFSRDEAAELWGFFDESAYSATEGWALGIQSYRVALEGNPDIPMSRIRAGRDIHQYLMDEILRRLSPEVRRFLFCTCLLPDLEPRTCDSLLGIGNSQKILEELARRNIFTMRISGSAYRYHTLFQAFLQENDDGSGLATVRMAMADCFDRGDYEQAIEYAMIAGDAGVVHDCLSARIARPFGAGRYERLKDYFDFLEAHRTPLAPRVLLARGMYLSSRGSFAEAERCLSAVADQVAAHQAGGEDTVVYLHANLHRARILRNRVSFEESTRLIDSLLPMLEGQPMVVWYTIVIEKIYNLTMTSRLTEALELARAMIDRCSVCGDLRVKAWFERYLTVVYFFMGDHRGAVGAYEKSLSIPGDEQDWLRRHSVAAYAASAYQVTGEESRVIDVLEAEMERLRQLGLYEELSINYLVYAQVLILMEIRKAHRAAPVDLSAFDRYANLAEEYATLNRSTREYLVIARILKACGRLLSEPEQIDQTIGEMLPLVDESAPFFQAFAYWHIADALNRLGRDPDRALEYCRRCTEISEGMGSHFFSAIAYGEAAAVFQRRGDETAALENTSRCMEISRRFDHRYFF